MAPESPEIQSLDIGRQAVDQQHGVTFVQSFTSSQNLSVQTRNGNASDVHKGSGCDCIVDVLAILDKLEIQQVATLQYTRHMIDGILSTNKIAVAQSSAMLDCLTCRSIPGCAMLLTLVCRNLVSQFQRVLSFVSSQYNVIANPHSHQSERLPSDLINGRPASLGNYCIDSLEEWIQMLHTLVTFRGRSLAVFLDKLKAVMAIVEIVGFQVQSALTIYFQTGNAPTIKN